MKKYLFITSTNYKNKSLTGAHRRLLELIIGIARNNTVYVIADDIPQLKDIENVKLIHIKRINYKFLPAHINGILSLCKSLHKNKKRIKYDYAISFGTMTTICYWLCRYNNVISILREDLIGYRRCINANRIKILYFKLHELITAKSSTKIIVQCKHDKENLISRTKKKCKNIEKKTFIQINNVNASWMLNTNKINSVHEQDNAEIVFIGNFNDERKGHSFLLPAAVHLLDDGFKFNLHIVGGGKQLDLYRDMFKKYECIQFWGQIDNEEKNKLLEKCNIIIVPSLIDSCPNTVLEGLNAGLAVYGANTGGIPDLLQKSEYMFEPNEMAIYEFLKEIISSGRYRQDAKLQLNRKEELTFDWPLAIQHVIEQ